MSAIRSQIIADGLAAGGGPARRYGGVTHIGNLNFTQITPAGHQPTGSDELDRRAGLRWRP